MPMQTAAAATIRNGLMEFFIFVPPDFLASERRDGASIAYTGRRGCDRRHAPEMKLGGALSLATDGTRPFASMEIPASGACIDRRRPGTAGDANSARLLLFRLQPVCAGELPYCVQIGLGLCFDPMPPRSLFEFQLMPCCAGLLGPFMDALRPGFGRTAAFLAKCGQSERYCADPDHDACDGEKYLERFAHFFSSLLNRGGAGSHVRGANDVMRVTPAGGRSGQRQNAAIR